MSEKLEDLISLLYQDKLTQYGKRLLVENIEKLQKENEELKALDLSNSKIIANMSTRHFQDREKIRESIPVQKVKEKIEELDKKVKDYQCVENRINLYQRKVLQELLEENENHIPQID